MTLESLARHAAAHPTRAAVTDEGSSLSYAKLWERTEELARELAPGAVVVALLPSGPAFTTLQIASLRARAVFVPLPHKSRPAELARTLHALSADLIALDAEAEPAAWGEWAAHARIIAMSADTHRTLEERPGSERVRVALPEHAAMIQYTSGSTGVPKGIVLSADNLSAGIAQNAALLETHAGAGVFSPMPQFHAMGNAVVLEHLSRGATVHLTRRSLPGTDKKRMSDGEVSLLVCSPSYLRFALKLRMLAKLSTLRAVSLGSAPSDAALLADTRSARPDLTLHLRYGLSEAFGALTRLDIGPDAPLPPRGLVGPPLPGVELEVDTEGEVHARSGAVGLGVLAGAELSPLGAEDTLATGDEGTLDAHGLRLGGRRSEFLKHRGYRIDPGEIEEALRAHPAVREAVVVGIPDQLTGQAIVAAIEASSDPGLADFLSARLSDHKIPKQIVLFDPLPRTPAGKPDRATIRKTLTPE